MIPFRFDRARMAELLDCLDEGRPIEVGRTISDYLMLAGACQFAAYSQGPAAHRQGRLDAMPAEHREAAEVEFAESLKASVEFLAHLAMQVRDGEYTMPPLFEAVLSARDGTPFVQLVEPQDD